MGVHIFSANEQTIFIWPLLWLELRCIGQLKWSDFDHFGFFIKLACYRHHWFKMRRADLCSLEIVKKLIRLSSIPLSIDFSALCINTLHPPKKYKKRLWFEFHFSSVLLLSHTLEELITLMREELHRALNKYYIDEYQFQTYITIGSLQWFS